MKLKFRDPPITELVIGVYFDPPVVGLRSEHIGMFFSRVRKEFPNISQHAPLGTIIEGTDEVFPMPRFWMITADDTALIQIQKNAFLFNWRKRNHVYPEYDAVKANFDRLLLSYEDFLRDEAGVSDLVVGLCELTYVNVIGPTSYWSSLQDTDKVIPSFRIASLGEGSSEFNQVSMLKIDDSINLRFTAKSARDVSDPNEPRLVFELKASGRPSGPTRTEINAWFDRAHDVVGDAFLHVTSSDIQKEHWGVYDPES